MRLSAALVLMALAAGPAFAEPIEISARPIAFFSRTDPTRTLFGPLAFRGGLVMTSTYSGFGGFSGLRVAADGVHFRALSDRAQWLEGRLVYDGNALTGIADAAMYPVRGASGRNLAGTRLGDTEALEISGTTAWVGLESANQIVRFDLSKGPGAARAAPVASPKGFASLPRNEGIEALGFVPAGPEKDTLLAIAEAGFDEAGNHKAWLLAGRTKKPARSLSVKRRDDYAVTDLAFLSNGDLVILERRYIPLASLNMRLRRIRLADIREGAVLDGEVLIEASLADDIDNMEGISVHRAADGADVLTLISDDNFNGMQRNVLLQFAIAK